MQFFSHLYIQKINHWLLQSRSAGISCFEIQNLAIGYHFNKGRYWLLIHWALLQLPTYCTSEGSGKFHRFFRKGTGIKSWPVSSLPSVLLIRIAAEVYETYGAAVCRSGTMEGDPEDRRWWFRRNLRGNRSGDQGAGGSEARQDAMLFPRKVYVKYEWKIIFYRKVLS